MARDGMMTRTTLLFIQVLDVLFQSFTHSTWVKNYYQIYGLVDFFFHFRWLKPEVLDWFCFFFLFYCFCILECNPRSGRRGYFHLSAFAAEGMIF